MTEETSHFWKVINTPVFKKLIAYGQLTGSSNDPNNKNKKLIETVIETICEAFHGVNTDPDVELQIIKVTSPQYYRTNSS